MALAFAGQEQSLLSPMQGRAGWEQFLLSLMQGRQGTGRYVLSASEPESGPEALVPGFDSGLCVAHGLLL